MIRTNVGLKQLILSAIILFTLQMQKIEAQSLSSMFSQQIVVPELIGNGWVNDHANILSSNENAIITDRLIMFNSETKASFVVLIVQSLQGNSIEDFGMTVFKSWGIGDADRNDGILLVISVQDRSLRIELGLGIEEIISDADAGKIINESIIPHLRSGSYYKGILAAIEDVNNRLRSSMYDTAPVAKKTISAVYPELAREAGVEGTVIVSATIGLDGIPRDLKVISGVTGSGLNESAMKSVKKTRFIPAYKDGRPIVSTIQIPLHFSLR